jgi:hypothetical protein
MMSEIPIKGPRWLLVLPLFPLTACATGPEVETRISNARSDRLAIYFMHAYRQADGVLVVGNVRRNGVRTPPPGGHVHIEAHDNSGVVVATADTDWGKISRRHRGSFSSKIALDDITSVNRVTAEIRERDD